MWNFEREKMINPSESPKLKEPTNELKDSRSPFEKYETLTLLKHKSKNKIPPDEKNKSRKIIKILNELEYLCSLNEIHLLNAVRYAKKILRTKHEK